MRLVEAVEGRRVHGVDQDTEIEPAGYRIGRRLPIRVPGFLALYHTDVNRVDIEEFVGRDWDPAAP